MAKKKQVTAVVKLQATGGQATPAPPVGTALGPHGVNIGQFVQQFNEKTRDLMGTTVPVIVTNIGTAPADDIQLTGSTPSGWKITFDPKTVDRIAPNDNKEVQALITPTEKAIAGDYVTTVRASARGESASTNFRVTVTTSTMWGIAGVGIIGVALLVMVGAVARFGRR